jgi:putative membrane protein
MTDPFARPVPPAPTPPETPRAPQAFLPAERTIAAAEPEFDAGEMGFDVAPPVRGPGWLARTALATGGLLVSLALGLLAEQLIRGLFDRYAWLGWAGIALLAAFVAAVLALVIREIMAVRRLAVLDRLRADAAEVLLGGPAPVARRIEAALVRLYDGRADLARARRSLAEGGEGLLDGAEVLRFAERTLMTPLDARARGLTAASARRVALVTAVSPRALVDVAFVVFESVRLAGAVAALYGARPGLFGFFRLTGAVLSHLAVTGGLVLTDGIVEQLVGQGLAARLSQRLGEGVVNGLMTVRVGIAAMRVVRPLPYDTQSPPQVRDFIPDLANLARTGS